MKDKSQISFDFHTFDREASQRYADNGMQRAVDHAEEKVQSWSDIACTFLIQYIKSGKEFMVEDVRKASAGIVPEPPSLRAWGGVIRRAAKAGFIYRVGYKKVSNVKAHATPASVWTINKN